MRRLGIVVVVLVSAVLLAPAAARADACSFSGAVNSDWNEDGNWSCGHDPTSSDSVTINSFTVTVPTGSPTVASLTLSGANLNINGGGTVTVSGAFSFVNGTLIGGEVISNGSASLTGASFKDVRDGGKITFNGPVTHSDGSLLIRTNNGPTPRVTINSTYVFSGGSISEGIEQNTLLHVGETGTLISTGTRTIVPSIEIDGLVHVQSGTLSLVHAATAATHSGDVQADGTVAFTAGSFHFVADTAPDVTEIRGGGTLAVAGGNLILDDTVALTVPTVNLTGGELHLEGTGPIPATTTVTQTGGFRRGSRDWTITTLAVTGGNHTGTGTDQVTTFTFDGGTYDLRDGGQLHVNGTGTQTSGTFLIRRNAGPVALLRVNGTYNFNGGALSDGGSFESPALIEVGSAGLFTSATAGTHSIDARTTSSGQISVPSAHTFDFTRGLTQTPGAQTSVTGTLSGPLTVAGGLLTGTGTKTGATAMSAGTISPASGTLTLAGLTQSGGVTQLDLGDVLAVGTHTLSGGILTGRGTLAGNLSNTGGAIHPGASPGVLTINGDFSQDGTGTLQIEIVEANQAGTDYDVLSVTGSAALGGVLAIVRDPGFSPDDNDKFQFLLSGSTPTGAFGSVTGNSLSGARTLQPQITISPAGARLAVAIGPPPENISPPTVSGTALIGQTITCQTGTWTNDPTFSFQWLRDGQPIGGATSQNYEVTSDDATRALSCTVTGRNSGGEDSATSASVTPPAQAPANTAVPSISGSPAVGQTLTCNPGTWTGAPSPTLSFQWLRDGQAITGESGATYNVVAADAGHALTCRVTATNAGGSASADSAAANVPAPTPTTPTPTPQEQKLATSTPNQVAQALGLPSARRCQSRRRILLRVKRPAGVTLASVEIRLGLKKLKVRKVSDRFTATIDLRGFRKGRFTVTITAKTPSGLTLKGKRAYKTCTPRSKRGSNRTPL